MFLRGRPSTNPSKLDQTQSNKCKIHLRKNDANVTKQWREIVPKLNCGQILYHWVMPDVILIQSASAHSAGPCFLESGLWVCVVVTCEFVGLWFDSFWENLKFGCMDFVKSRILNFSKNFINPSQIGPKSFQHRSKTCPDRWKCIL